MVEQHFNLTLDTFGPYTIDYTRNGRHLLLGGRKGHVATFDWRTGTLHAEIQLRETVRDVQWLHDESMFAVAQKKYVYVYDRSGMEVHCLRDHLEVNRLDFLPYHHLLVSVVCDDRGCVIVRNVDITRAHSNMRITHTDTHRDLRATSITRTRPRAKPLPHCARDSARATYSHRTQAMPSCIWAMPTARSHSGARI